MGYNSLNEVGIPRTILIQIDREIQEKKKKNKDEYLLEQDVPCQLIDTEEKMNLKNSSLVTLQNND